MLHLFFPRKATCARTFAHLRIPTCPSMGRLRGASKSVESFQSSLSLLVTLLPLYSHPPASIYLVPSLRDVYYVHLSHTRTCHHFRCLGSRADTSTSYSEMYEPFLACFLILAPTRWPLRSSRTNPVSVSPCSAHPPRADCLCEEVPENRGEQRPKAPGWNRTRPCAGSAHAEVAPPERREPGTRPSAPPRPARKQPAAPAAPALSMCTRCRACPVEARFGFCRGARGVSGATGTSRCGPAFPALGP